MKNFVFALALLSTHSALADDATRLSCISLNSIDGIAQTSIVSTGANQLLVKVGANLSMPGQSRLFDTSGTLADARIQLSETDRGVYGVDRVYLEKTAHGHAIVKINQCDFATHEETCSAVESERFSEIAREETVVCKAE